jgi:hypothetical protein
LTEKTTATLAPEVRVPGNARRTETADDGDAGENLLSGPRNVQAYVIKRGEQYMSREQLDHFRMILQNWKQDLMLEVDRTVSHMKDEAANFPDPNDRATQHRKKSSAWNCARAIASASSSARSTRPWPASRTAATATAWKPGSPSA